MQLIKRELLLVKDRTEHGFKGDKVGYLLGTKTDEEGVYHNTCLLFRESGEEERWHGRNFGFVKVDKSFIPILGDIELAVGDEELTTNEDVQRWKACTSESDIIEDGKA